MHSRVLTNQSLPSPSVAALYSTLPSFTSKAGVQAAPYASMSPSRPRPSSSFRKRSERCPSGIRPWPPSLEPKLVRRTHLRLCASSASWAHHHSPLRSPPPQVRSRVAGLLANVTELFSWVLCPNVSSPWRMRASKTPGGQLWHTACPTSTPNAAGWTSTVPSRFVKVLREAVDNNNLTSIHSSTNFKENFDGRDPLTKVSLMREA